MFDWTMEAPVDWHGRFDRILLDVPCSNTGVLRRRVDARWRLRSEQIADLGDVQQRILENALPCLKPDGRLLYSTCSLEPAENEEQVAAFQTSHPGVALLDSRRSLPFRDGFDGSYAALLSCRTGP